MEPNEKLPELKIEADVGYVVLDRMYTRLTLKTPWLQTYTVLNLEFYYLLLNSVSQVLVIGQMIQPVEPWQMDGQTLPNISPCYVVDKLGRDTH